VGSCIQCSMCTYFTPPPHVCSVQQTPARRLLARAGALLQFRLVVWAGGMILTVSLPGSDRLNTLLKIPRLLKMARILRAIRIIPRLESTLPLDYGIMLVAEFVCMTALLSHWIACVWGLLPQLEHTSKDWLTQFIELYEPLSMRGARYEVSGCSLHAVACWSVVNPWCRDITSSNRPRSVPLLLARNPHDVFSHGATGWMLRVMSYVATTAAAFTEVVGQRHAVRRRTSRTPTSTASASTTQSTPLAVWGTAMCCQVCHHTKQHAGPTLSCQDSCCCDVLPAGRAPTGIESLIQHCIYASVAMQQQPQH
jgi:hypothetical protein